MLIGFSLIGEGGDADVDVPDLDAPDVDLPDAAAEFDAGDFDAAGADTDAAPDGAGGTGVAGLLGLGEAPFMVWLLALLLGFGLTGYVCQLVAREVTGALLTPWPIAAVAALVGLLTAKRVSGLIARLLPQVQTTAVSENKLGGRVGVITVGTARKSSPAEAKVTDRHGNVHYIRVVPMRAREELTAGTEIAVMRGKNRIYRAVRLEKS